MASQYPGAIDVLSNPAPTDNLDTAAVTHSAQHQNSNDAIEAIEATLGINPQGDELTVAERLAQIIADLSVMLPSTSAGAPGGIATLDVNSFLQQNVDASKVASGTLDAARIPGLPASKITSGTFDTARIPSLDASKVNTGTFAAARIPNLPASVITSGTLDPARVPSAPANALTVADITARDALSNKVDGQYVFVKNPASMWMWNATSLKWEVATHTIVVANVAARDALPAAVKVPGIAVFVDDKDRYDIWNGTAWATPGGEDTGEINATGSFTGAMRFVKFGKIVFMYGYVDRDDDFGTAYISTGISVPVNMRPAGWVSGSTSEPTQAQPGYNSANQYRYRVGTTGLLEIQRTGVITTFMAISTFWVASV
jgi:hypothetical protein